MNVDSQIAGELFEQAVGLSPNERTAFLDAECGSHSALRQRIEQMLAAAAEATELSGNTAADLRAYMTSRMEMTGDYLGRYKLLQEIGEGGCGTVYMAEQEEPVRRKVALKLIKRGMDTRQVIARFEAERQALAMMDHPNIAKVFDAGETKTGQPFFVMELVRGLPITKYCDQEKLRPEERLKLFIQVCQAIQHAHQKGIIHRDIKPSNVLVAFQDGIPVPKVIDFGIAKAIEARLTDKTLFTAVEQFMGTPAYMSPEQAEMSSIDIDTRSDIYSLGVLLYELLTGTTPFDTRELLSAGIDEIRRKIREDEPPKPSTRLSALPAKDLTSTAKQRQLDAPKLVSHLRGDLDWVVMKALEKDRTRRYETASALALDIGRHLNHEPVTASPISATYRLRKFIRRNKLAFAAASAVVLALLVGGGVSAWQALRATQAVREQTRLRQETVLFSERLQLKQSAEAFAKGDAAAALMFLARLLRDNPTNRLAAERLMSALAFGRYALPKIGPMTHKYSWITTALFSPDGTRLVTGPGNGGPRIWDTATGSVLLETKINADTPWVDFSPDGKQIATASQDTYLRLWDATDGRLLLNPIRHEGRLNSVRFSPDGSMIACGGIDAAAHVWNASMGIRVGKPLQHRGPVWSVEFDATGSRAITASSDGRAIVWDPRTGEKVGPEVKHEQSVWHACFSRDGHQVATASHDGTARVWNAATGEPITPPLRHQEGVRYVEFSPNGSLVATASDDGTARLWDISTGQPIGNPMHHTQSVWSARFSPDGHWLLTCSDDFSAKIWRVATGDLSCAPLRHDRWVRSARFSPDGSRILTASFDGTAVIWTLLLDQNPELEMRENGELTMAIFNPVGRSIMTLSGAGRLRLWNRTDGKAGFAVEDIAPIIDTGFLKDAARLWTVASDGGVRIWSASDGKPRGNRLLLDGMQKISVSSDGNWISGFSPTNSTRLWIISTTGGKRVGPLVHAQPVWRMSFSPDARRLVSLSHDTSAHLWDVSTGAPIGEALRHDLHASSAVFSPDSSRIATTGHDKLARIWNASDGRPIHSELRHAAEVRDAIFSLDSRLLATLCEDRSVTIWNVETGLPITVLAHSAPVSVAAFSPDGVRLATASGDKSVRVWDVRTGLPLSEPLVHPGKIASLSFAPEGSAILTASADGVCRVWPVPILVDAVPRWMPELAEFLAGQKLGTNAVAQPIQRETIDAWISRLDKDSFDGPFARSIARFQR